MLWLPVAMCASEAVSLDSCRRMALSHNKQLLITGEKVKRAGYQKKSATAAYLPSLDFEGSYVYNQKQLALIEHDAMLPTKSFDAATGKYNYNIVTDPQGAPVVVNGQPVPSQVALLPKSALTYDIHNVFAGAVTLTQPVFMGGKIRALNKIARYAESLAVLERDMAAEEVVYNVDAAYWQVVSLKAKEKLARSYVALLDTLNQNVNAMLEQGVATKSDALSVAVKLNEASVDMVKVENGLALARMLLAQQCGMPVNTLFTLEDEDKEDTVTETVPATYSMSDVYASRKDVKALELAVDIYEQKAKTERASMLPQVAIVGAYSVTNPNSFNGFKNEFGGMFSVGAMVKIPLWHWGSNYNKYRAAKSDAVISRLQLADAKDKIALQVSQASYKMSEAAKNYKVMRLNREKAEENLRMAMAGFREGVLPAENVMEAQTAWLKSQSETIDAAIDMRLCEVYLDKVLGKLNVEEK
ncbi:MAG: TolC family protein [Muribaculaceae bacterium]|nr:TolC family protein [Muribaculaceae bacterium]